MTRRRRATLVATLLVSAVVVVGALLVVTTGGGPHRPPSAVAAPSRAAVAAVDRAAAPTLIATLHGDTPRSPAPGAPADGTVPGTWYGEPSALPVIGQAPGWDEVRLAQRPDGSTGWVPAADVTLARTPYRITIDLSSRHLQLWDAGRLVVDAPAGVGTSADPTVTGHYFVALFARAPSAGYGPFVMVTSAHSTAITDWERSGDAIIAIHGPLGADRAIGTTGAAISHGCVRLHDADLQQLRAVPAGTPIDIVD